MEGVDEASHSSTSDNSVVFEVIEIARTEKSNPGVAMLRLNFPKFRQFSLASRQSHDPLT